MGRPAEYTRDAIIKAAVILFAEKGFEGTSVRDIVAKAGVNQAAINYHFKGKSGLYLEVLKTAFARLTDRTGFSSEELRSLSREDALRTFISQSIQPRIHVPSDRGDPRRRWAKGLCDQRAIFRYRQPTSEPTNWRRRIKNRRPCQSDRHSPRRRSH